MFAFIAAPVASRTLRAPHRLFNRAATQEHRHPPWVCSIAEVSEKRRRELIDLYTITETANPDASAAAAERAYACLDKFLALSPVPSHTRHAFERACQWRQRPGARRRLVLDVGCGTAHSSVRLARSMPDMDVIGVDRSLPRLARNAAFRSQRGFEDGRPAVEGENLLLLRANVTQFWRLCVEESLRPDMQFILYPNPYPRNHDLKRRFYAQPSFPLLARLGGALELRSSWAAYLEDWRTAHCTLQRLGLTTLDGAPLPRAGHVERIEWPSRADAVADAMTCFEAKYNKVGMPVYRLVVGGSGLEASGSSSYAAQSLIT